MIGVETANIIAKYGKKKKQKTSRVA